MHNQCRHFLVFLVTAALAAASVASVHAADFHYSYANPYDAAAQDYIFSTSNIKLYSEGSVRVWIPITGGASEASTTPGVIIYKFDFGPETVASAFLRTNNPTFHWSYSEGHNYFYGSKDGATWTQLLDVTTPAYGAANSGVFNGLLPAELLGASELWFKAELFSFGSNVACCGDAGRNTAQHSRWDTSAGSAAETFKLDVDFAPVPVPAALPLFGAGLGLLGLSGWRHRRAMA